MRWETNKFMCVCIALLQWSGTKPTVSPGYTSYWNCLSSNDWDIYPQLTFWPFSQFLIIKSDEHIPIFKTCQWFLFIPRKKSNPFIMAKKVLLDFPGGLVIKTPCSQWKRGVGSIPGWGIKIPYSLGMAPQNKFFLIQPLLTSLVSSFNTPDFWPQLSLIPLAQSHQGSLSLGGPMRPHLETFPPALTSPPSPGWMSPAHPSPLRCPFLLEVFSFPTCLHLDGSHSCIVPWKPSAFSMLCYDCLWISPAPSPPVNFWEQSSSLLHSQHPAILSGM